MQYFSFDVFFISPKNTNSFNNLPENLFYDEYLKAINQKENDIKDISSIFTRLENTYITIEESIISKESELNILQKEISNKN